jgi:LrgB-like family
MPNFVDLWIYLSATPLFGLTATLVAYVLAQTVYVRLHHAPLANPVLWTVVVLAGALLLGGVSYPVYFAGAQFIHFLLGPAVVALGWPLWQRREGARHRRGSRAAGRRRCRRLCRTGAGHAGRAGCAADAAAVPAVRVRLRKALASARVGAGVKIGLAPGCTSQC